MTRRNALAPILSAIVTGALLFLAAAAMSNRRDPLDSSAYWGAAYPAALVASGVLGYVYPDRPWRWALWLFQAQFVAMCMHSGELGHLWPVSMLLFAIVALPAMVIATRVSRLNRPD